MHKQTLNLCFRHQLTQTQITIHLSDQKWIKHVLFWDNCSDQNCKALENCHLRAARIVTGAKKNEPCSHNTLYAETNAAL